MKLEIISLKYKGNSSLLYMKTKKMSLKLKTKTYLIRLFNLELNEKELISNKIAKNIISQSYKIEF